MLVNKRLSLLSYNSWTDVNDRRALSIYQSKLNYGFVGAMCLTQIGETFHHWQIFAGGSSGVCVVFDKTKFTSMFQNKGHFLTNSVEYILLDKINSLDATDIHRLPFIKRWGFRDEREYRVIGYLVENKISAMHVALNPQAIKKIVLSPFMNKALGQSVANSLRQLSGWGDLCVEHSELIDNQNWQTELEGYCKRHGIIYAPWEELKIEISEE